MDLTEMRFKISECKDFNNAAEVQNAHFELSDLNKEITKLEHFKDTTVGLYATDKPITDLLYLFFNHKSDANKYLIAEQQEDLENDFKEWAKTMSFRIK